ncbi:MAG: UpxY family transcription antiterminator [Prevotella sp.]|nr:UpxY family transcription antiterminator [Prevotella sp.]
METLAYNLRDENEQFWFVMGSKNHMKELQIRDEARTKGLEAFVPITYAYKTIRGQKQRKLIPAINGYIFVKATTKELEHLITNSHYAIFPQKSTFTGREDFLIVPNHDMENFIAVIEKAGEHITYFQPDEISLNPGDKIRIQGGFYDGCEGIITRIKGKRNKHLVVQITGVLIAAIELSPEMIELSSEKRKVKSEKLREVPSKDIDKDKKKLLDTAHRLLFDIPNKHRHEEEYYLLLNELKRTAARIQSFKGYTPASEAQLALPLYLTAVILNNNISQTEERLLKAVEKLKDTSKFKKTCLEYLEKIKSR